MSGAIANRSPNFDTVGIEENLIIGGDARAASDLYVDGTLHANDIFVPGIINIDGSMNVGGRLTAGSFEIHSGATVHGPLNIDGVLVIDGKEIDLSGLVSTGSMLNLSSLLVKNSMMVLGDITIEGMAEILGDVSIGGNLTVSGALTINNNQAGYAVVVETGTSAVVTFGSGVFASVPIVTASSDDFVPWRIRNVTGTGFTIETKEQAVEDITFSWHAMLTEDPKIFKGLPAGASTNDIAFFVDPHGVPLSTSDIWNECIRSYQPLGLDGKPFNCRRYYDEDMWSHPDHDMQFMWDADAGDMRLVLPRGYYTEVVGEVEKDADEPEVKEAEESKETEEETGSGDIIIEETEEETGTGDTIIEEEEQETGTGETVIDPDPETPLRQDYEGQAGTGEVIIEEDTEVYEGTDGTEVEEESEEIEEENNNAESGDTSPQLEEPEPEPEIQPTTDNQEPTTEPEPEPEPVIEEFIEEIPALPVLE